MISNLKAHYEEEKDQVVFEANRRLDEFKEKFALTNDQTKKIATLETALDQFQLQKLVLIDRIFVDHNFKTYFPGRINFN